LKTKFGLCCIPFFTLLACSFAEGDVHIPSDCEERLAQFIPADIDTSLLAMRAVIQMTSQAFIPNEEMRRKQLEDQYQESAEYQEAYPTSEAFIEVMTPLIAAEEESESSNPIQHSKIEVIISATNAYARYFNAADFNTPTQEVIQIKFGIHAWRTIRVDHIHKTISETIEKNRNEYFSYFSALTPQLAHRTAWQLYPVMLRMEKQNDNIYTLLCESGRVQISDLSLLVEFVDDTHCIFKTQMPVPKGTLNTEYELEIGKSVRLLYYSLQGPELTTHVTYTYSDPESPWPSRQHLVDRNILSDQTLRDRSMDILEVASVDKWNFISILDALMTKYSSYPYKLK
jgi:hypothetical protein